ncbi:hypothetical protein [Demequina sp. NBRC 110056]|uniref:hypothetical protein n=1 Tax=Demequina sp. NBRC 110056 TaxID=1570345 RepID=UPI00118078BC|nr:hypothetical protein [Demequina sp. NBRC 110056]
MDNAQRTPRRWVWPAAIALAVVGATAVIWLLARPAGEVAPSPSASPVADDACGGIDAYPIELDTQVVEPEPRTCFVIEEALQVTVGAAALEEGANLTVTLLDADLTELTAATSEPGWDPEVGITLDPGVYVIEVSSTEDPLPPFLIYTATFPAGSDGEPTEEAAADLPSVEACGDTVPWVADDAPLTVEGADAATYACVDVTAASFVKLGLASEDPSDEESPDLQLALYDADGTLVRSADDELGFDPEMSLDLDPGTYLLEATAWFDVPPGAFEIYVDDDADLFRSADVTSLHADVTEQTCADAAPLVVGDAITVEGEVTYLCLTTGETDRVAIEAATLTDQDLVLEVIGFDAGAPYRIAWADENPEIDVLANFDPRIDQTLPAGTWLVAVTTYFAGTAADYDIRVEAP